jgi:drug/metabolite transporter (DMT)-like permease
MSGAANLAPSLLALGAAFCFAVGLILTQYGLRTVPSCRLGSIALVAPLVALRGYFAAGRNLSMAK